MSPFAEESYLPGSWTLSAWLAEGGSGPTGGCKVENGSSDFLAAWQPNCAFEDDPPPLRQVYEAPAVGIVGKLLWRPSTECGAEQELCKLAACKDGSSVHGDIVEDDEAALLAAELEAVRAQLRAERLARREAQALSAQMADELAAHGDALDVAYTELAEARAAAATAAVAASNINGCHAESEQRGMAERRFLREVVGGLKEELAGARREAAEAAARQAAAAEEAEEEAVGLRLREEWRIQSLHDRMAEAAAEHTARLAVLAGREAAVAAAEAAAAAALTARAAALEGLDEFLRRAAAAAMAVGAGSAPPSPSGATLSSRQTLPAASEATAMASAVVLGRPPRASGRLARLGIARVTPCSDGSEPGLGCKKEAEVASHEELVARVEKLLLSVRAAMLALPSASTTACAHTCEGTDSAAKAAVMAAAAIIADGKDKAGIVPFNAIQPSTPPQRRGCSFLNWFQAPPSPMLAS
eukprot:SM000132S26904  [mRNA]  locus=s132:324441:325975:+ [translate_table: standard]